MKRNEEDVHFKWGYRSTEASVARRPRFVASVRGVDRKQGG